MVVDEIGEKHSKAFKSIPNRVLIGKQLAAVYRQPGFETTKLLTSYIIQIIRQRLDNKKL